MLDAIAHSEKTPTAVAAFLVSLAEDARTEVEARARRLLDLTSAWLARQRESLAGLAREVVRATERHLQRQHNTLAQAGRGLHAATMLRLSREQGDLQAATARIRFGVQRQFERATARLDQMTTRQRLLDPARVLGRGYALVRSPEGRVLPSATRLQPEQTLVIQFRDGRATAHVTEITQQSS